MRVVRCRRALLVAVALVATSVVTAPAIAVPGRVAAAPATTSFRPVTPCRLLDTRDAGTRMSGNSTKAVVAAGRCDVPAGAVALALVVTVTNTAATGYLTVWPSGEARPLASTINFTAGNTRANGAVIELGADGAVAVYTTTTAHVVVDVTGAFVPEASGHAVVGRFVPAVPTRLLDTRTAGGRPAPGTSRTVPLPAGVPADAVALAVNITTTETLGAGFFAAYPTGTAMPVASVLNSDGAGQTRAAGAIVPVNAGGFQVFTNRGDHIVVDYTGYFTGPSAGDGADGLFVPIAPTRLVDTRTGGKAIFKGGALILDTAPVVGTAASAVVGNWTSVESTATGYVTVYPAFTAKPGVSTTNVDKVGVSIANLAVVPVTEVGVTVYLQGGGHVVADLTGWFTGTPTPTTESLSPLHSAASAEGRRVLLMGDSTLAGLRWYSAAQVALRGANYVLDLESCRRLIGLSCGGREGRRPPNAVDAINAQPGTFDVVVIMTGYNDWYTSIPSAFDAVVAASRAKGATEIVWLTYRVDSDYTNPTTGTSSEMSYMLANAIIHTKVASGDYPDVRIADWSTYTAEADTWFTADGIHFTVPGAYGAADFISRHLAFGWGEPCPMPWTPGGAVEEPCSTPDVYSPVVDVLGVYGASPTSTYCYLIGTKRFMVCSLV